MTDRTEDSYIFVGEILYRYNFPSCNKGFFDILYKGSNVITLLWSPNKINIMSLDISALIRRQEKIINDYLGYRELQKENAWKNDDLRVTILDTLANELVVQLIHIQTLKFIWSDEWWISHFPNSSQEHQKKQYRNLYLHRIRWWLFVSFVGIFESKIRLLTAHLENNPSLVKEDYWNIYTTLLASLGLSEELLPLFKIITYNRNLQHHNGYYMPRLKIAKKETIIYRNVSYIFTPGELWTAFKIDTIMDIYEDIYSAIVKIITSDRIKNEQFISDKISS